MVSLVVTLNLLCVTDILDDALIAAVSDMFSDALSNICVIDSILLSLLNLHPEKLQIITAKTKASDITESTDFLVFISLPLNVISSAALLFY